MIRMLAAIFSSSRDDGDFLARPRVKSCSIVPSVAQSYHCGKNLVIVDAEIGVNYTAMNPGKRIPFFARVEEATLTP
jgi:hypothetical protein